MRRIEKVPGKKHHMTPYREVIKQYQMIKQEEEPQEPTYQRPGAQWEKESETLYMS